MRMTGRYWKPKLRETASDFLCRGRRALFRSSHWQPVCQEKPQFPPPTLLSYQTTSCVVDGNAVVLLTLLLLTWLSIVSFAMMYLVCPFRATRRGFEVGVLMD